MQSELIIFTDGACKGNPGRGGWGFLADTLKGRTEKWGGSRDTTNNRMELRAAIKALEFALEDENNGLKVILYTDSNYVKNGIESWMAGWIRNGWKTAAKKPVKNKDLWIELNKLNKRVTVDWRWVKGHSNHPGNERADYLANKGVPNA